MDLPQSSHHTGNGSSRKRPAQVEAREERGKRRAKYTRRACEHCRRRKVKCCGSYPCRRCAIRNEECTYAAGEQQGIDREAPSMDADISHDDDYRTADGFPLEHRSLANRIEMLEEELKSVKTGSHSTAATGPNPEMATPKPQDGYEQQPEAFPGEETDAFEVKNCGKGNMSLWSKLQALHDMLAIDFPTPTSLQTPLNDSCFQNTVSYVRQTMSLKLPSPSELLQLLQVFFREHNPFFPCIDQIDLESRFLKWISEEGYGASSHNVAIGPSQIPLAALTCVVFAVSQFIDPQRALCEGDKVTNFPKPGHVWYQRGISLLKDAHYSNGVDLDLIRFHTLEAMYLHYVEQQGEACRAVFLAVSISIRSGLNNQMSWTGCSAAEVLSRRTLWWTLYYIDRRVAEKCGQPYCVRDVEIDVDDFTAPITADQTPGQQPDVRSRRYLQSMIDWSRLWGQMWDTFFALRASKLGDPEEIEAMNARIEAMRSQLPPELTWNTESFEEYVNSDGDQRNIRYRLLTFTRINLLQMILHQNPLMDNHDDLYTIQSCATIATRTIKAIAVYMQRYCCIGQLGHFAAVTLVECICHLIPSIVASATQVDSGAVADALYEARQLLHQISTYRGAARRAEKVLEHIFDAMSRILYRQALPINERSTRDPHINSTGLANENVTGLDEVGMIPPLTSGCLEVPDDWLLNSFLPDGSWSAMFDYNE